MSADHGKMFTGAPIISRLELVVYCVMCFGYLAIVIALVVGMFRADRKARRR